MLRSWAERSGAAGALLLGAVLAAVAFGAAGGTELERTTVVEILLVLAGGVIVAVATLRDRGRRLYGATALLAFVALALVTALSITWSIAPELSFVEAGRSLAYLAVFAAAVAAARLAPAASPVVLKGILLGAVAVTAYALASRVWPASLAADELSARLGQPFDYWNAVGTTAAIVVPAALWLGSRRAGSLTGRALAFPAVGLAVVAILLTQSRGALAAAAIGAALWFLLVPLRLRSLPVLVIPALGAAPVSAWALSKDAFIEGLQPLAVRQSVSGEFGLFLAATVALLFLAGLAACVGLERRAPPVRVRRRVGVALVAAVCAVPLALFTSVAFSDRGIGGTIEDRVDDLTNESASTPRGASRFTATSSSRSRYWREAGDVFSDRPGLGTGAGTFGTARLRYRDTELVARHAHGFIPQTLSDLGLVGLGAVLALLAAWLAAAARTTGLLPRRRRREPPFPRRDWDGERVAVVSLGLVAVVFGLQSAIDWTWFVPGPVVMAIVAAGFVAGRGPVPAVAAELPAAEEPATAGGRPSGMRLLAAAGVLASALLVAWAIWQPERSDRASTRALELIEDGEATAAATKARDAQDANPLSAKPLLVEAAAESAGGGDRAALERLDEAVLRFPGEPQTWLRRADFQLHELDRPRAALRSLEGALYLDPKSKEGRSLFLEARARLRDRTAERR